MLKKIYMILFFVIILLAQGVSYAVVNPMTFPAGSIVLPSDSCWQPNTDPNMLTNTLNATCDTDMDDRSLFQLYGLLYAFLDVGDDPVNCINDDGTRPQQYGVFKYCKQAPVYWIIDRSKTDPNQQDMVIQGSADPLVSVFNSTSLNSAGNAANPVFYSGGPFVIKANDLTASEITKLKAAIINKFPSVKMHIAEVPFSANVEKVLIGKPPKVAVLSEGASDVLEDYIRASGLFSWKGSVFSYVDALDVIDGCLQESIPAVCNATTSPFQLLWAPHWEIEKNWQGGTTPTSGQQTTVVQEIRDFLEKGNAGFFECASVESLEGSPDTGQDVAAGVGGYLAGGNKAWPRIEKNEGCSDQGSCDQDYLVFEESPFWLMQCGGWNYEATGGHVHNLRPTYSSNYRWLSTLASDNPATSFDDRYMGPIAGSSGRLLTRFIHDDAAKLNNAYPVDADNYYIYDYLIGGRINASPTQGYVVYFPGHKYVKCNNSQTYTALPARTVDIQFDNPPPPASTIWIELVHAQCSQGVDCPKVSFDLNDQHGTIAGDSWVELSTELSEFDFAYNILQGVFFSSQFDESQTTELQITDIIVTFDNNLGTVKLENIIDRNDKMSLCAPDSSASPVSCSLYSPESLISLHFSGDIANDPASSVVQVQVNSGGPSAQFDLLTGIGTLGSDGDVSIDLTGAQYDLLTNSLRNITLTNLQCKDYDINDVLVTFPDSTGSVNLNLVYNDTTSVSICSPVMASIASCAGGGGPPPAAQEESIDTRIEFDKEYQNGDNDVKLEITYNCGSGCSGTLSATYDVSNPPGGNSSVEDSNFRIDMSGAVWDKKKKKLENIVLTNKDNTKTLTMEDVKIWFKEPRKLKLLKDTTNNKDISKWGKKGTDKSPATDDPNYILKDNGGGGGGGPALPVSVYEVLKSGICNYGVSPYLTTCDIDWNSSNTCGIKYVLNTLLALKFQVTSSEYSKTQPIVKDSFLYKASYDFPIYRGHLKKIRVPDADNATAITVWDALDEMPKAGTTGNPVLPTKNNFSRYLFTTLPDGNGVLQPEEFEDANFSDLMTPLGASDEASAKIIINSVRGRRDATYVDPVGTGEAPHLLWAIEHSTPALMTNSKLVSSANEGSVSTNGYRDIVAFAGAADGILHAIHAGSYDTATSKYDVGTGKEIWGYLPKELLGSVGEQPFNVQYNSENPLDYSIFEPKVSVDGSPAIGDFLVNVGTVDTPVYEWRTYLVETAEIRNTANEDHNKGILFSLDVSNPYTPEVLWEERYYDTDETKKCLYYNNNGIKDEKNCNMGRSKGVAIGSVFFGSELKSISFVTANWAIQQDKDINLNSDNYNHGYCTIDAETEGTCSDQQYTTKIDCETNNETWMPDGTPADCVYGMGGYAIDLLTGDVIWDIKIPYTGDAVNISETPAVPALMDIDNNGTSDYLVYGDTQGRIWAINTVNGESIAGVDPVTNNPLPVYEVPVGYDCDPDTHICTVTNTTSAGPTEPVGASVSTLGNIMTFGTGASDSDFASNDKKYHMFVIRLLTTPKNGKYYTVEFIYETATGEKIWAKPLITSDRKVIFASAKNYWETGVDVSLLESVGRVGLINLKTGGLDYAASGGEEWIQGGVVGGVDAEAQHAYVVTLKPSGNNQEGVIQIGGDVFTMSTVTENPYKILWWRKL